MTLGGSCFVALFVSMSLIDGAGYWRGIFFIAESVTLCPGDTMSLYACYYVSKNSQYRISRKGFAYLEISRLS